MIVCGLPGSVLAISPPSLSSGCRRSALTTRSTSRNAATAVAEAEAKITSKAPSSEPLPHARAAVGVVEDAARSGDPKARRGRTLGAHALGQRG